MGGKRGSKKGAAGAGVPDFSTAAEYRKDDRGGDGPSVDALPLPPGVAGVLKEQGIERFYRVQADALKVVLSGESLVMAVPTASGKSLVAYIALVRAALAGGKGIYIVPLRALASEKHEELSAFGKLGLRVALSMGDYDRSDERLGEYDIIVATSEKADSLLRHKTAWLSGITAVVADEVHLLNDPDRGPTLEVLLARLKALRPAPQTVALSATIPNAGVLAKWLGAKLVKSDWRPVKLLQGVHLDGEIEFEDGAVREVGAVRGRRSRFTDALALAADSVKGGGQSLVFVSARRWAESVAEQAARMVAPLLSPPETEELKRLAASLGEGEEPTSLGGRLAKCIEGGAAFHTAALTHGQRSAVEKAYRKRLIKVLAATPTLAAGINLPARRVVIKDHTRYDPKLGNMELPVLEVRQMAGRAGRPRFDTEGEAVLLANDDWEREHLFEKYIRGECEPVESRLANEGVLRVHLLAAVASGFAGKRSALLQFLESTFYHHQGGDAMGALFENALRFLTGNGFINAEGEFLTASPLGKRTSDLYLDPLSVLMLKRGLDPARAASATPFSLLHLAAALPELRRIAPFLRETDYETMPIIEAKRRGELLLDGDAYGDFGLDRENLLADIKTALLLEEWIDEAPEKAIEERYSAGPGDIRNRVETAEWLLGAMQEIDRLLGTGYRHALDRVMTRAHYGAREELMDLLRLRGIGRRRARALFASGATSLGELSTWSVERLTGVPGIGEALAAGIVKQLGKK